MKATYTATDENLGDVITHLGDLLYDWYSRYGRITHYNVLNMDFADLYLPSGNKRTSKTAFVSFADHVMTLEVKDYSRSRTIAHWLMVMDYHVLNREMRQRKINTALGADI